MKLLSTFLIAAAAIVGLASAASAQQAQCVYPAPAGGQAGCFGYGVTLLDSTGAPYTAGAGGGQTTGAVVTTSQASVTTTAAILRPAGTFAHSEIQNTGSAAIYVGPAGVTTGTGYPIPVGATYDASRFTGALYAIAAATQTAALISY